MQQAAHRVLAGLATITATLALASPAFAAPLPVTKLADTADGSCDADCSLREAVIAANASPEADTIQLPAGTLTISVVGMAEQAAATGDLDVLAAGGTLSITGLGAGTTTIDGAALDRIFDVRPPARLELADVTVRNGAGQGAGVLVGQGGNGASLAVARTTFTAHVTNGASAIYADNDAAVTVADSSFTDNGSDPELPGSTFGGAGIFLNDEATATVARSTFARNRASFGGGAIFVNNASKLTLSDSTLTDNFGDFGGGALFHQNDARSTVTRSTFTGNRATFGGGAIFNQNDAVLDISASVISQNRADNGALAGGGIFNQNDAVLTISGSTISGNTAVASIGGGGLFHQNNARTTITASTISGNTHQSTGSSSTRGGGGIHGQNTAELTLVNATISGNQTDFNGGGLILGNRSVVRATNTTIAGNTATGSGGALFNGVIPLLPADVHVQLANTIIAGNLAGGVPNGCAGTAPAATLQSLGHNLEGTSTCGLAAAGDLTSADPQLGALAANGGATLTHAIAMTSPAKDTADAARCPATDQRGVVRPQFAVCDIGAFELEPAPPAPPAPAPVAPSPPPVAKPKAVAFSSLVSLPSTKKCVSRRNFRIRLRVPRGVQVSGAEVRVNGKRVRTIKRSRITAPVDLRNLPKGRFSVEIRVKLADGRTIKGTRKYRTCAPKRKAAKKRPRV